MNLLDDPWIPLHRAKSASLVSLKDVLCTDTDWHFISPRDDMELAALQLLSSLTQVIFPVADQAALRARLKAPMTEAEYEAGVSRHREWFDLDHPRTPFMQTRGVSATDPTSIQKLFIGLPEGNNHTFFNAEGEIRAICGGCVTVALFNQANNCPSFGGGFKGSLRGSAPITTLIDAPSLRRRIWENVLPLTELTQLLPDYDPKVADKPVWVDPIPAGKSLSVASIGLLRGLFWQPAKIELLPCEAGPCDHCGCHSSRRYGAFNKEKFNYQLDGVWPHPHSPRQWEEKKGERHVRFASFTTTAPTWTQLTRFLIESEERKQGNVPAAVVTSRRQRRSSGRLQLLVGGYRNNQAKVIERRHELFNFAAGWEDAGEQLADLVELGLSVKKVLRGSLYFASEGQDDRFKGLGVNLYDPAENAFYHRSEAPIHQALREMDYDNYQLCRSQLLQRLTDIARQLYAEAVAPYLHDPELVHAIAAGRTKLIKGLQELKESNDVAVD